MTKPIRVTGPARAGWGAALLLVPEPLLRRAAGAPVPAAATTVARVLGTRQLVQAVVMTAVPGRRAAGLSAAVDALHAATGVALAVASPRWRRIALADAAFATVLAVAAWRSRTP
ncbi:hypothetical protein Aab01nite_44000 [Paractinoplanes abujensis]|uniref:Uncharacterized protein n=1 Tax=Paractinoplanes abujensis TaxID=882441 RepID=A0A7W7FZ08_9ACTN|nr:hypothetical protein [Actinoplanes abujensis]MBB4690037.1 hypothetical protein [Actinoplanes abujensis]GID20810.1 hypothetical protein Aab01nite_44000 [Actinoplanes abujensis]